MTPEQTARLREDATNLLYGRNVERLRDAEDVIDDIFALPDLAALLAASDGVAEGWVLVPSEATRKWAHDLATWRQGQRETPRCEMPSFYDVKRAQDDIAAALATRPTPAPIPATPDEAAIRADERERCAALCDHECRIRSGAQERKTAKRLATAIRANQSRPVETAGEVDEDWFEEVISDTLDMDWQPRWAARAILTELGKLGLSIVRTPTPSEGDAA